MYVYMRVFMCVHLINLRSLYSDIVIFWFYKIIAYGPSRYWAGDSVGKSICSVNMRS